MPLHFVNGALLVRAGALVTAAVACCNCAACPICPTTLTYLLTCHVHATIAGVTICDEDISLLMEFSTDHGAACLWYADAVETCGNGNGRSPGLLVYRTGGEPPSGCKWFFETTDAIVDSEKVIQTPTTPVGAYNDAEFTVADYYYGPLDLTGDQVTRYSNIVVS